METFERKNWSTEDNFKLINIYKSMPELWDQSSPFYKERSMKLDALNKLAGIFDTNVQEMRRRLHNLRAQFTTELRRLKFKSLKLNVPPAEVRSDWKYFDKLSYLMVNYPRFYNDDFTGKTEDEVNTDIDASNNSIEYSRRYSQSDDERNDSDNLECKPTTSKRTIHKSEEVYIPENEYHLHTSKKKRLSDEDHRIFGEYVTSELRNLSDRGVQKLKMKIRKAILEVTEEEYNANDGIEYLEFHC